VRGCLFTLALAAVVVALIVVVGLPAMAAGLLTAAVRAAGLQSDNLAVVVTAEPPWDLVGLHADRVRVRATSATYQSLQIGSLDVTLSDVSLADRSARGVDGQLTGVTVPDVAGEPLGLAAVTLSGGGSEVDATTAIAAVDARALVAREISGATGLSLPVTAIRMVAPNTVSIKAAGLTAVAKLSVDAAGDLVATVPSLGPVKVLSASAGVPIRLTSITVDSAGGLVLGGRLEVGLLGG
jgi:hypothetical protein